MAGDASQRPIRPLQIDYEPEHEAAIVEVVARLDEIGDVIDGGLPTEEETVALLALLAP